MEIDWGPGPPITSGYTDGHRVEMYVSITNTEGVMAILMISRSRDGHIGILIWKLLGVMVPLAPLAMPMAIESTFYVSTTNTEGVMVILMIS